MADYAVKVDFPDHKRGDHWPAVVGATAGRVTIGPILIDGSTPDSELTRLVFTFKHITAGTYFRIDSEAGADAPLVIDDEDTWEAHIPEIANFLPTAGIWTWDAAAYDSTRTTPLTIYKGAINVLADT